MKVSRHIPTNRNFYKCGNDIQSLLVCYVENVVQLSQRKTDDYVEVELELDELDVTLTESKATYAEIKDYVLKEH